MDTTYSTLIGVAVGAVTASVPKFWDLMFEKSKYKRENQKAFFERKLNVLQAYVSACTQLSASNFNTAVSVEQLKNISLFVNENPMTSIVIENLDKNSGQNIEAARQLTELSSAASMFIDLNIDRDAAYNLVKSIHVDIAKIGVLKNQVDRIIEKYDLKAEPLKESMEGKEFFPKKMAFQNHLQGIADKFNRVRDQMNECIDLVRRDFLKYDK